MAAACGGDGGDDAPEYGNAAPVNYQRPPNAVAERDYDGPASLAHTLVFTLEDPGGAHDGDTGAAGLDEMEYEVAMDTTVEFCFDDLPGAGHAARFLDADGGMLGEVAPGDCQEVTLPAGRVTLQLEHDGTSTFHGHLPVFVSASYEPIEPPPPPATRSVTCTAWGTVVLKNSEDRYVSALHNERLTTASSVGATELFTLNHCGDKVAFQASGGRWVAASGSTDDDPCEVVMAWPYAAPDVFNTFTLTEMGDTFTLQSWEKGWRDEPPSPGGLWTSHEQTTVLGYLDPTDATTAQSWYAGIYTVDYCYLQTSDGSIITGAGTETQTLSASPVEGVNLPADDPSKQFRMLGIKGITVQPARCIGCNLEGANFAGYSLPGVDFATATLTGASFSGAYLPNPSFQGADLTQASFSNADIIHDTELAGLPIDPPNFSGATLVRTDFSGAVTINADFDAARIDEARFDNAQLINATFVGVVVDQLTGTRATFVEALIAGVDFSMAKLDYVDLTNAQPSTTNHALTIRVPNSATTEIDRVYDVGPTIHPLSTTSETLCPNGQSGPCTQDYHWVPNAPRTYEGFDNPDSW